MLIDIAALQHHSLPHHVAVPLKALFEQKFEQLQIAASNAFREYLIIGFRYERQFSLQYALDVVLREKQPFHE